MFVLVRVFRRSFSARAFWQSYPAYHRSSTFRFALFAVYYSSRLFVVGSPPKDIQLAQRSSSFSLRLFLLDRFGKADLVRNFSIKIVDTLYGTSI
jgi:hypothetical protein